MYEMLIGLNVTDDAVYDRYRENMKPILHRYGGDFRYDFRVGEVLKSETAEPINRLFLLVFPDQAARAAFFTDEEYVAVRTEFFDASVGAVTVISEVTREVSRSDRD